MRKNSAGPGDYIHNLRYRNESGAKDYKQWKLLGVSLSSKFFGDEPNRYLRIKYLLAYAIIPYVFSKVRAKLETNEENKELAAQLTQLDKIYRGFNFFNLMLFLRYGKYRSLADRFLGMTLVPYEFQGTRPVAFEVVSQQILFDSFSEMLLSIIRLSSVSVFLSNGGLFQKFPALARSFLRRSLEIARSIAFNILEMFFKIDRKAIKITFRGKPIDFKKLTPNVFPFSPNQEMKKDSGGHDEIDACVVCGVDIRKICNRYQLGCGHYCCYMCLQISLAATGTCCRCSQPIEPFAPN